MARFDIEDVDDSSVARKIYTDQPHFLRPEAFLL